MSYKKVDVLEKKWILFERSIQNAIDPIEYHVADLHKLMTAKSVVDLGTHAIYSHTQYLHKLSVQLLNLQNTTLNPESIFAFTDLLKTRNEHALKIKHHKRLAGFCTFDFTLQRMEGQDYGLKRIHLLDPNDAEEFTRILDTMKALDCLAHGANFGSLPLVGDTVLSAMLAFEDTRCFIAKDKNEQIIAYAFGILLRDVTCENSKANVFHICNLAKHPDFYDPSIKVGAELRHYIANTLKEMPDCHFISYQHNLNHKFHTSIVEESLSQQEAVTLGDVTYQTQSELDYDFSVHRRYRIIKTNTHQLPFPKMEEVESAFINALWKAAHSGTDFILGALSLYGRIYYKQWTNSLLEKPFEMRIEEPVSLAQQLCDKALLKTILLSNLWDKQRTTLFFDNGTPCTIKKIRQILETEDYDFSSLKQIVAESGWSLTRSKLTAYLYLAITQSLSPTAVINRFIEAENTPKEWIKLIDGERQKALAQTEKMVLTLSI